MNDEVEDLLRESMQRFTADLRAPAGLMRRAERSARRRRLALRSAAVTAAALTAAVVALAAVVVPGASGSADAAAYVVKRVNSALGAAGPGQIAQMIITTRSAEVPGGTTVTATVREWSYGGQWRSVTYSPAGHPVYDEGLSAASVYTLVSYKTRTWARQAESGGPALPSAGVCRAELQHGCTGRPGVPVSGRLGCGLALAALSFPFRYRLPGIGLPGRSLPTTVPSALHTAISCGILAVAGRQRVDGIDAIELKSRPDSPVHETIWVSPGTYLPVRVVISALDLPGLQQTADITWLPPTARNLAKLTVPIPTGYRHIPLAEVAGPAGPKFLATPRPTLGLLCASLVPSEKGPALPVSSLSPLATPRLRLSCHATSGHPK